MFECNAFQEALFIYKTSKKSTSAVLTVQPSDAKNWDNEPVSHTICNETNSL